MPPFPFVVQDGVASLYNGSCMLFVIGYSIKFEMSKNRRSWKEKSQDDHISLLGMGQLVSLKKMGSSMNTATSPKQLIGVFNNMMKILKVMYMGFYLEQVFLVCFSDAMIKYWPKKALEEIGLFNITAYSLLSS